ncbi:hypothetical protein QE390_000952 [Siphonobacter sp. SORGH_AS 1065]|nr:hypothetical protein [Siphonobacter sp. SORGH_AS_1065]
MAIKNVKIQLKLYSTCAIPSSLLSSFLLLRQYFILAKKVTKVPL